MRPPALDALELVVVVDNETDTLSSIDAAVPQRPEVASLVARTPRDRPDQRGILTPSGVMLMLPLEPTLDAIADAGGRLERHDEPHLLADDMILASGAIASTTAYEAGVHGHLSACSHAGIVNACLTARSHFPGTRTDLVFGGYHLAGAAMEARIAATVDDLDALITPRLVAPAHCTGWRAKAALAQRFAPPRYAPSAVGSRYVLDGSRS